MGGQTKGETMAYGMVARLGAGVTPNQMHAERIDGYGCLDDGFQTELREQKCRW